MSPGSKIHAELNTLTVTSQRTTKNVQSLNNECGFWDTYCFDFTLQIS